MPAFMQLGEKKTPEEVTQVMKFRQAMLDALPDILKAAELKKQDKRIGQTSLLDEIEKKS